MGVNMATIIAVGTQKGGVGKTTTSVNLAHALAYKNNYKRVLFVDMDPQANGSLIMGNVHPDEQPVSVSDLFEDKNKYFFNSIVKTKYSGSEKSHAGVDLIPSNIDLFACSNNLNTSNPASVLGLQKKLDQGTLDKYDYIIIDCPPALGGPLLINALVISDYYLMPIECASFFALNGIEQFIEHVDVIKQYSQKDLKRLGVLITMFDPRTNASNAMLQVVTDRFGDEVFKTRIHRNTAIDQAHMNQVSVIDLDTKSSGSKNYRELAKEVIARCESVKDNSGE